jgi:hypothetical protein
VAICGAVWCATLGHRAAPSLRERLATVAPYDHGSVEVSPTKFTATKNL